MLAARHASAGQVGVCATLPSPSLGRSPPRSPRALYHSSALHAACSAPPEALCSDAKMPREPGPGHALKASVSGGAILYGRKKYGTALCQDPTRLIDCVELPPLNEHESQVHDPATLRAFEMVTETLCNDDTEATWKAGKSARVFAIVTHISGRRYRQKISGILEQHAAYARRHGMQHIIDMSNYTRATRGWNGPFAAKMALRGASAGEWLLWIDAGDVLFTNGSASPSEFIKRARLGWPRACHFVYDHGTLNSGVYLIQRSCEGARLLDHWYAMRRWARIGNNAAYMLAILHARLGLPLNASDDERHRMPCVHVRPSDNFVKCPMSLSVRAPKAGPVCPLQELAHTLLTGNGLLAHFPGDKACVQPLLRILRTDGGGVRPGAEGFGLHTRRHCDKRAETLCCTYGTCLCMPNMTHG